MNQKLGAVEKLKKAGRQIAGWQSGQLAGTSSHSRITRRGVEYAEAETAVWNRESLRPKFPLEPGSRLQRGNPTLKVRHARHQQTQSVWSILPPQG